MRSRCLARCTSTCTMWTPCTSARCKRALPRRVSQRTSSMEIAAPASRTRLVTSGGSPLIRKTCHQNRTPEGLGDDCVVLQDFLHYGHVLAPFVDVEGGSRQFKSAVEGAIGVLALVPRHTRAIAQFERHDAERAVRPGRKAKGDFVPDL